MSNYLAWLIGFHVLVGAVLALDLGALAGRRDEVGLRVAMGWTLAWIALGLAFGGVVAMGLGPAKGLEYFAAYVIEKALSVDNIFVFILVFATFGVAPADQRKVLLWGIIGAIAMRGAFIAIGSALLERFHWIIYGFGLLLVWSAWRAVRAPGADAADPAANPLVKAVARWLPIAPGPHEGRFFRREAGRWTATSLFLALVAVEASDLNPGRLRAGGRGRRAWGRRDRLRARPGPRGAGGRRPPGRRRADGCGSRPAVTTR